MLRTIMAVVALSTLAACSDNSITSTTTASLAGTYSLQSVSGRTVPFVQSTNPTVELIGETLVVNSDGTFTITTNRRNTDAIGVVSTQIENDAGSFTMLGSQGAFHFNTGNTASAAVV